MNEFSPKSNNTKTAFSLIELSVVILIIGILVLGVTQGSRMMSEVKLTSARSLTTSSPVASIEGLAVWLDSTSENAFGIGSGGTYNNVSAPGDGAKVGRWNDINPTSTSKIDVVQSTLGNQPIYKTNAINGLPALKFDGSDDDLITGPNLNFSNEMTVFVLTKLDSFSTATNGKNILSISPIGSGELYLAYGTNKMQCYITRFNPVGWKPHSTSLTNLTNLISLRIKETEAQMYINGGDRTDITVNIGNFPKNNALYLGRRTDIITSSHFPGHIGEVIIFNRALKDKEIKSIESYLGQKWGIKVS